MANSKIEWTEKTWNPTTGCDKVSQGCKYCYAEVYSNKLYNQGIKKYRNNFDVILHHYALKDPYKWDKPCLVFVNSMSDLFHEKVPLKFIKEVFGVMDTANYHTYQVLTKRAERLLELNTELEWSPNIWMGVSVEDNNVLERIDMLKRTGAKVKFLSIEPLLEALPNLELDGIDWVIVGGESGKTPRPMKEEWVQDILQQCRKANVPFFFKQWGGQNKWKAGRLLNGRTYDEMPILR